MQDPNADTEWNDALRKFGILPPKEKEISEEEIVQMIDSTVQEKMTNKKDLDELNLDELDLLEDEEDDRILLEYRKKRIAELQAKAQRAKFGEVIEISAEDYIAQVNKAGEGIWVVLHLYKPGIPTCKVINYFLQQLAIKFPETKFVKSVSTTCIPNFPDEKLPTIFVYRNGELLHQLVGPEYFHANLSLPELEWILSETKAIKTDLEEDPRPKIKDHIFSSLARKVNTEGSDDEDDW